MNTPITDILVKKSRHLPHWQLGGRCYHVVFRTISGIIPAKVIPAVIETIRLDEGKYYILHIGVVMPNHVHLLLQPLELGLNKFVSLSTILKRLKGVSANKWNKIVNSNGSVWSDESFDHIIRNQIEFEKQVEYIYLNPVRSGLVTNPEDYPHLLYPTV